ncbi:MAG: MFS transporter, partial [Candidatus Krumholzibacteria bacterium]|nr:MFS transporter [Candidatus Krumholzibacteria bacterium]
MNGPPGGKNRSGGLAATAISTGLFTAFWTAQAVSLFGDRLNNFSLVALVNRFSDDPSLQLSGIYAAMYLPVFLLAPIAGVIVDRLSKRWILAATDLARGLLVLLIPAAFTSTGSFIPVMAVVFMISAGNLLFLPAKSGLLPEIVPPDKLVKVNSILWIAGIAGVIGGFLGGGIIFDYFSWQSCFYLDGVTYIFSALLLTVIALRL